MTVTYAERVPVGRRMAATVAPLTRGSEKAGAVNILVLLRDLTEVERINQMRADFIANASHELRTPLASLRGFIETLQGSAKGDPGARERFLPIMAEQASRMTRLIDALLSLSRRRDERARSACRIWSTSTTCSATPRTRSSRSRARPASASRRGDSRARRSCAATATNSCKCSRTSCTTPSNMASEAARCGSRPGTFPRSAARRAAMPSP